MYLHFHTDSYCRHGLIISNRFNSLEEPDVNQDYLSTPWACPVCLLNFYLTGLGRLRHQVQCQKEKELAESINIYFFTFFLIWEMVHGHVFVFSFLRSVGRTEEPAQGEQAGYFCPDCQTILDLSGVELIRHQRRHQQAKMVNNDDGETKPNDRM